MDVAPLLAAIKAADTEGRLTMPGAQGISGLIERIRGRGYD